MYMSLRLLHRARMLATVRPIDPRLLYYRRLLIAVGAETLARHTSLGLPPRNPETTIQIDRAMHRWLLMGSSGREATVVVLDRIAVVGELDFALEVMAMRSS